MADDFGHAWSRRRWRSTRRHHWSGRDSLVAYPDNPWTSRHGCSRPRQDQQYLLHASDIPAYADVRAKFLGQARPASMLVVVPALVRPDFLIEIEAYAAK